MPEVPSVIRRIARLAACMLLFLQGLAAPGQGLATVGTEEPDPATDRMLLDESNMERDLEQDLSDAHASGWLFTTEGADRERLLSQTKLLAGLCVVAVGVLYSMPESVTGWDRDVKPSDLPERWWNNVSRKPVWDDDRFFFNYVSHPYVGGVYYQMARKSGYNQRDSLLFTALMSTFLWEYGVEAFAERPSVQDLIVTPLAGWALGEWAFRTEKRIVSNQGRVLGSKALGEVSLFALDPMSRIGNGINRLVGQEWILTGAIAPQPSHGRHASRRDPSADFGFGSLMVTVSMQLRF